MKNSTAKKNNEPAGAKSEVTPAMRQFLEIKQRHQDCLLFYRMGDFYELFFDDAVKAAEILDIALTKRGKHEGQDIPMCGVPAHSHEAYLEKLIRSGVKVAICEQLEEPHEAKKRGYKAVISRDVVRIVTAGTITEENLLDARSSNYLAVIVKNTNDIEKNSNNTRSVVPYNKQDIKNYIIAWLDISTGEFNVINIEEKSIAMELSRIFPRELLVPDSISAIDELKSFDGAITQRPDNMFEEKRSQRLLKEFYNISSLDVLGDFNQSEIIASASLLDYIRITQKETLPRLDLPRRQDVLSHMLIDSATKRNLELLTTMSGQKKGSLFSVIDKTITSSGARLLAGRISAPHTDIKIINGRLNMVQAFFEQSDLRSKIRLALKECPDMERALSRLCLGRGGPRDALMIASGLSSAQEIRVFLELSAQLLPLEVTAVAPVLGGHEEITSKILSIISKDCPLLARDGNFVRAGHNAALDELRRLRDDGKKLIVDLQQKYIKETGIASLKIRFNNMLGYFVEITQQHQAKITSDFIHRQTLANNIRYSSVELSELERKIGEAAANALKLEQEIFAELLEEIKISSEKIIDTARAIAEIDVATSLAHLASERDYTRPLLDNSFSFDITSGRHPVVEESLKKNTDSSSFIANSCDLENSRRLWLLTGPNMAGKSTFLRQNALIAILAQIGSYVPATSATIGIVDRMFSRVGAADDLARGHSTFMVEMVETATILNQATERSLVILDEIGRGTATFDGLSLAWAVVEYLHDVIKCRSLFATHYHELTELKGKLSCLSCHTMKVKEWKGELIFMHEVATGSADRSYGIHVAKLAGLPEPVIRRAGNILRNLENQQGARNNSGDSLPLFARDEEPEEEITNSSNNNSVNLLLLQEILDISLDDLTPKQALDALYNLKNKAEELA
ncbi:MAG: DNA mismatch repair protein MutS [Rickettsiales bacterium]